MVKYKGNALLKRPKSGPVFHHLWHSPLSSKNLPISRPFLPDYSRAGYVSNLNAINTILLNLPLFARLAKNCFYRSMFFKGRLYHFALRANNYHGKWLTKAAAGVEKFSRLRAARASLHDIKDDGLQDKRQGSLAGWHQRLDPTWRYIKMLVKKSRGKRTSKD